VETLSEEDQRKFREHGAVFGYPECCTEFFIKEFFGALRHSTHDKVFYGTGFRACLGCANIPFGEVVRGINSRRIFSLPFPFDHPKDRYRVNRLDPRLTALFLESGVAREEKGFLKLK
jgi:hypothetical protein